MHPKPHARSESHILPVMTATARFSRVAVAVAFGAIAPLVLRAEPAPAPALVAIVAPGARLAVPESAAPASGPARRARQPAADTSLLKRERGKTEHAPAGLKRRVPKAKSGAATSPQPSAGGQYVPDQPWETEFFVQNTIPARPFAFRLASATGY